MPHQLTDDLRHQHFVELSTRGVEARRQKHDAVTRLVETTRAAQGLDPTVSDVEVLEHIASLIDGGDGNAT